MWSGFLGSWCIGGPPRLAVSPAACLGWRWLRVILTVCLQLKSQGLDRCDGPRSSEWDLALTAQGIQAEVQGPPMGEGLGREAEGPRQQGCFLCPGPRQLRG